MEDAILHRSVEIMMQEIRIPLRIRARRRVEALQLLLQAPPAVSLFLAARPRIGSGGTIERMVAAAELATSGLLVLAILRELRSQRDRSADGEQVEPAASAASRLGLVDLAAGVMLLTEWADRLTHGGKMISPTLLSALVAIGLAMAPVLWPNRKGRRRTLRLNENGLSYRAMRWQRFQLAWREIDVITRRGDRVDLGLAGQGAARTIDLATLDNGEDVWRALANAAREMHVEVRDERVARATPPHLSTT
jgi:hypothetical protein